MANQAVTELIIDATGADRGEAQYRAAMDRVTAAGKRFEDQQTRTAAAMEKGVAAVTMTTTAIDRQTRAWEGVVAKVDPVAKATLTAQREMERAVRATTAAVESGVTTQIDAERTLAALRKQQVVHIEDVREAQQRLNQTARGGGAGAFQTANIASQFQDVAITAAMGMSPATIALQQGSQLSMALAGVTTLRGAVAALGTAFGAMLNPVSLATIAVVGLAAAGIQWASSMLNQSGKVEAALKAHEEELKRIVKGWGDAEKAVNNYADTTGRLPRAAAILQIGHQISSIQSDLQIQMQALSDPSRNFMMNLGSQFGDAWQHTQDLVAEVDRLQIGLKNGSVTLDQFVIGMTKIELDPQANIQTKALAQSLLEGAANAGKLQDQLEAAGAAAKALSFDAIISGTFGQLPTSQSLASTIRDMAPDLRTSSQVATDFYNAHSGEDVTGEAKAALDYTLQQIKLQEQQQAALRAAHSKSPEEKSVEAYQRLIRTTQQSIQQTQLQARTLGMTDEQANAFLHTQNLLNQAANSNIKLTPEQTAELTRLGAAMASVEADAARITDIYNTGRDATRGFFSDTLNYLRQAAPGWKNWGDVAKSALDAVTQAAGNLINKLADKALTGVADALWNFGFNVFSGGGQTLAPGVGDPWAGLRLNADGNVFMGAPGLNSYANTIVNRPTLFPFANGIGLMGETGDPGEAIMPLRRSASGRLGVEVANKSQANDNYRSLRVEVYNEGGQQIAAKKASMSRQGNVDIARIIVGTVNTAIAEGKMDGAMAAAFGTKRKGH